MCLEDKLDFLRYLLLLEDVGYLYAAVAVPLPSAVHAPLGPVEGHHALTKENQNVKRRTLKSRRMSMANEPKAAARCTVFACTRSPGLGLGRVSSSTPQPRIQSEDVVVRSYKLETPGGGLEWREIEG